MTKDWARMSRERREASLLIRGRHSRNAREFDLLISVVITLVEGLVVAVLAGPQPWVYGIFGFLLVVQGIGFFSEERQIRQLEEEGELDDDEEEVESEDGRR